MRAVLCITANLAAYGTDGSKAAAMAKGGRVRFAPQGGLCTAVEAHPLWANNDRSAVQQYAVYEGPVAMRQAVSPPRAKRKIKLGSS
jgi:hypothetical protein